MPVLVTGWTLVSVKGKHEEEVKNDDVNLPTPKRIRRMPVHCILVLMPLRLNELLKMVTGSKSTYYIACNANSTRCVTGVPYV